jgi:F0F1-type ATP synthase assembly protein I
MKSTLLFLAGVALLASCSAPKYTYNFDHYNYIAGKKKGAPKTETTASEGPQAIQPELLMATSTNSVIEVPEATPIVDAKATPVKKTYAQMTKTERKELRAYLKTEVKNSIKAKKENLKSASSNQMDEDLKLAVIFGAVGIVGLIIGGDVFYIIGGIAMLIGVVFFVKWVIRQ